MPSSYKPFWTGADPFDPLGWGKVDTTQKSEDKIIEILTSWGQHPDTMDPDLMGSRVYLNSADINELAKLILEAGFRLG